MSSQQMVAILCSETPEQHEACRILENGDKEVVIAFWCFDAGEKYRNDRYSIVFNTPERGQYPGVACNSLGMTSSFEVRKEYIDASIHVDDEELATEDRLTLFEQLPTAVQQTFLRECHKYSTST